MRPTQLFMMMFLFACGGGKDTTEDGSGDGDDDSGRFIKDGRLIADVFTWECLAKDSTYPGVYAHKVSLEYAPNALRSLDLPAPGDCAYGLDMFPTNAGAGGSNIDGIASQPEWETDYFDGELELMATGFWFDDVLGNEHLCQEAEDRLEGGTSLLDAGILSGLTTPIPSDIPEITYSGFDTVIEFGEDISISWSEHEWEQVWIQLRRESGSDVVESVTCNVSGELGFNIDSDIWSLLDSDLNVEKNNLYVAFQRAETMETNDEQIIDTFSRVIDIAVIVD